MADPIGMNVNPNEGLGGSGDAFGTKISGLQRPGMHWDKVDPRSVNYRQAISGERCDNCQMSQFPPGSNQGVCSLVKPPAAQKGFVCNQWEPILWVTANQGSSVDLQKIRDEVAKLSHDSLCLIEYARDFTQEQRDALANKGQALKNKSYPIETVKDLKNAIRLARSGHGDVPAAKHLIKKMAKKLGAETLIPEDWDQDGDG